MDKSGRCLRAGPVKLPFDINESRPAQQCAASSPDYAACPANVVHESNRVNGIPVQVQGSSVEMIFARRRRASRAEWVSSKVAVTSPGRAINTRSQPEAREASMGRMASRKSRLARLRWTAVPVVLPAATPTLIWWEEASLACTTNTTSGWAKDLPVRRTRLKSSDRDRRNLLCTRASM